MAKFRKKPVVIEAFRIGIDTRPDWFQNKVSSNEIITFVVSKKEDDNDDGMGRSRYYPSISFQPGNPFEFNETGCIITTIKGDMRGDYGDYIIQDDQGEIYPCKPEIFEKTYEKI